MTEYIEILFELLWYFQLILVSGILHESGHYLLAKYYKLDPKIKINGRYISVYYKITDHKKNLSILFAGIIAGLVYILYWTIDKPFDIMNVVVIIGYMMACNSDILQIYYYAYGRPKNVAQSK